MYLYDDHQNPTVVDYLPPIVTKAVKDDHTSRVCEKMSFEKSKNIVYICRYFPQTLMPKCQKFESFDLTNKSNDKWW